MPRPKLQLLTLSAILHSKELLPHRCKGNMRGLKPLLEMGMNLKEISNSRSAARLPDFMFNKVISGDIGLEKALAYGSEKISYCYR